MQGVSRTFGATRAVDNVSFAVQPGELLGLIGPNGAGKSTLFNLIAGVMPPSGGKIRLDGIRRDRMESHMTWRGLASLAPSRSQSRTGNCPSSRT